MSQDDKIEEMSEISDERMKVIVVDSVKGGCGKTTISLKYAAMFARECNTNKVCYIDLDILGSSIETFINGSKFIGSQTDKKGELDVKKSNFAFRLDVEKSEIFHLNEIFKGRKFRERFFNKIRVTENNREPYYFDLIACSPHQDDKDQFKPSRLMNYVGQIDYEYFAAMIENMLRTLEEDEEYTHIVIDMPPNSDAYTDSVFNILLRKNESGKEKIIIPEKADPDEKAKYIVVTKYNVEICVVNSLDRAHFEANFSWLRAMIDERRMEWALHPEQNFKIVFNNNSGIEDDDLIKNYFRNRLHQLNKLPIKKTSYFVYDRLLAINSMNDDEFGFDKLKEDEIQ